MTRSMERPDQIALGSLRCYHCSRQAADSRPPSRALRERAGLPAAVRWVSSRDRPASCGAFASPPWRPFLPVGLTSRTLDEPPPKTQIRSSPASGRALRWAPSVLFRWPRTNRTRYQPTDSALLHVPTCPSLVRQSARQRPWHTAQVTAPSASSQASVPVPQSLCIGSRSASACRSSLVPDPSGLVAARTRRGLEEPHPVDVRGASRATRQGASWAAASWPEPGRPVRARAGPPPATCAHAGAGPLARAGSRGPRAAALDRRS